MKPLPFTLLLCSAEILGLSGMATFSALLPDFIESWRLSNTDAGWLSAVYYGAYVIAVPLLTARTDRRDAKHVLLFGLAAGTVSSWLFAFFASDFASAAAPRFLAGISLAGVYMPGLKLLSDHVEGSRRSRYVSFYTSSFSLGAGLSYYLAGELSATLGWRWAFAAAGALTLLGFLIVLTAAPSGRMNHSGTGPAGRSGFSEIFRERKTMAYILGYAAHMWELFAMRSWIVAFLAYSLLEKGQSVFSALTPSRVAALINVLGVASSIGGNELCRRFGRKKTITRLMMVSVILSVLVGFSASLPYGWAVLFGLIYGVFTVSDSASLTAGAVENAPEGGRGATLAVHSTLGFGAAFLGPLAVGVTLDLLQHHPAVSWAAAFAVMGGGCALGPLALRMLESEDRKSRR